MLERLPREPLAFPDDVPERPGEILMFIREIDDAFVYPVSQSLGVETSSRLFSPT
jgi:hypothetical protein